MRHRINSASSAPLSVRSAGSRLSSRTLPSKNKQKPITGRPSSAPVSILKQTKRANFKESEKSCELQVIGKAVRNYIKSIRITENKSKTKIPIHRTFKCGSKDNTKKLFFFLKSYDISDRFAGKILR